MLEGPHAGVERLPYARGRLHGDSDLLRRDPQGILSDLFRHRLTSAPSLNREIHQLGQSVPHGQHGLGIVEVDAGNEVESGNRRSEHIHEANGGMMVHQVPAAFRAVLSLAERRLLECRDMLSARGDLHRLRFPEAEGVHRPAGPGSAGLAMTIAHHLWFPLGL
jgi:hypothetical protein